MFGLVLYALLLLLQGYGTLLYFKHLAPGRINHSPRPQPSRPHSTEFDSKHKNTNIAHHAPSVGHTHAQRATRCLSSCAEHQPHVCEAEDSAEQYGLLSNNGYNTSYVGQPAHGLHMGNVDGQRALATGNGLLHAHDAADTPVVLSSYWSVLLHVHMATAQFVDRLTLQLTGYLSGDVIALVSILAAALLATLSTTLCRKPAHNPAHKRRQSLVIPIPTTQPQPCTGPWGGSAVDTWTGSKWEPIKCKNDDVIEALVCPSSVSLDSSPECSSMHNSKRLGTRDEVCKEFEECSHSQSKQVIEELPLVAPFMDYLSSNQPLPRGILTAKPPAQTPPMPSPGGKSPLLPSSPLRKLQRGVAKIASLNRLKTASPRAQHETHTYPPGTRAEFVMVRGTNITLDVLYRHGRGGSGAFYECQLLLGGGRSRTVGLKAIPKDLLASSTARKTQLAEIHLSRIAACITDAPLQIAWLQTPSHYYLVMEFVGIDLETFVECHHAQLSTWDRLCLIEQCIATVAQLQEKRPNGHVILHRDIKAPNLLVGPKGVKLADLGNACVEFADGSQSKDPIDQALVQPLCSGRRLTYHSVTPSQSAGRTQRPLSGCLQRTTTAQRQPVINFMLHSQPESRDFKGSPENYTPEIALGLEAEGSKGDSFGLGSVVHFVLRFGSCEYAGLPYLLGRYTQTKSVFDQIKENYAFFHQHPLYLDLDHVFPPTAYCEGGTEPTPWGALLCEVERGLLALDTNRRLSAEDALTLVRRAKALYESANPNHLPYLAFAGGKVDSMRSVRIDDDNVHLDDLIGRPRHVNVQNYGLPEPEWVDVVVGPLLPNE
eukprot:comp23828_c0_seq1/m.41560 comp23828_c0_seq1/g.41560  ORF comp23828_c0_seq1/g.41560 comp23828_c0_seq1/m.41560 type:complete len:827 (-) comp23828_c0_seq1:156-2636(-)